LFKGQLKNLHEAVLVSFKAEILASLKVKGYNFEDVINKASVGVEARFSEGAREAVITEGEATWQWEEELQLLQKKIPSVAEQLRKDETKVCNSRSDE
jgi:hypothetical protein